MDISKDTALKHLRTTDADSPRIIDFEISYSVKRFLLSRWRQRSNPRVGKLIGRSSPFMTRSISRYFFCAVQLQLWLPEHPRLNVTFMFPEHLVADVKVPVI